MMHHQELIDRFGELCMTIHEANLRLCVPSVETFYCGHEPDMDATWSNGGAISFERRAIPLQLLCNYM